MYCDRGTQWSNSSNVVSHTELPSVFKPNWSKYIFYNDISKFNMRHVDPWLSAIPIAVSARQIATNDLFQDSKKYAVIETISKEFCRG